jgi:hypothetical protein
MSSPELVEQTVQALGALLAELGQPGGVLVVMKSDGYALVVASMPVDAPVSVSQLLKVALHGAETVEHQGGAGHLPAQ